MSRIILVVFAAYLVAITNGQNTEGDACFDDDSKTPGVCTIISKCATALQSLQNRERIPKTCGFKGTQPIVCCKRGEPGAISLKKCREYSKFILQRRPAPILLLDAEETERNECGHKVVELIVGGELSKRKEFPHTVAVGYETKDGIQWFCGGSLISEDYVLTAGHCIISRNYGPAKHVRMGITNLESADHMQQFKVAERIPHPDYKPPSHYNDIGLLKMEGRAKLNPFLIPICLNVNHDVKAKKAIASGFGKTGYASNASNLLLKVTLDLIDDVACNKSYENQISRKLNKGIIPETQVCAGSLDPLTEKDTCQGDSGGPLQIYHINDDIQCMYDIIGITSFGKACSGSPGIYTRVSNYINWIEEHVWSTN